MARAVDPTSKSFVDTMKLLGGQFAGRTLVEIATSTKGLIYLNKMCEATIPPQWLGENQKVAIAIFLARPERAHAVEKILRQDESA